MQKMCLISKVAAQEKLVKALLDLSRKKNEQSFFATLVKNTENVSENGHFVDNEQCLK